MSIGGKGALLHKLETHLDFHLEEKADILEDTEELVKVVNEVAIKLSFHITIGTFVRSKLL